MKKKEKSRVYGDLDRFDRKQKRVSAPRQKGSSKHRLSIYDEFEEEDLTNYTPEDDELDD
jgi:hypothetical protein